MLNRATASSTALVTGSDKPGWNGVTIEASTAMMCIRGACSGNAAKARSR